MLLEMCHYLVKKMNELSTVAKEQPTLELTQNIWNQFFIFFQEQEKSCIKTSYYRTPNPNSWLFQNSNHVLYLGRAYCKVTYLNISWWSLLQSYCSSPGLNPYVQLEITTTREKKKTTQRNQHISLYIIQKSGLLTLISNMHLSLPSILKLRP